MQWLHCQQSSLITGSVSAASGLNFQASISAKSYAVGQNTSYTVTITNAGTGTIGSANITVPTGYSLLSHFAITQQPSGQNWTATLQTGKYNYFIIVYGSTQGLTPTQSLTFTFDARNPLPSGTYKWTVGVNGNTTTTTANVPQTVNITENSSIKINSITAAILILIIALGIAFLKHRVEQGFNQLLRRLGTVPRDAEGDERVQKRNHGGGKSQRQETN